MIAAGTAVSAGKGRERQHRGCVFGFGAVTLSAGRPRAVPGRQKRGIVMHAHLWRAFGTVTVAGALALLGPASTGAATGHPAAAVAPAMASAIGTSHQAAPAAAPDALSGPHVFGWGVNWR